MSSYITTHNSHGQSCFSNKVPPKPHLIPLNPNNPKQFTRQIIYDTNTLQPDLSTESDIDSYASRRTKGYADGMIHPDNGFTFNIITIAADTSSQWHRTMTLDSLLVLEGEAELHLESGEVKIVKAGDTVVQRGTMHKWKNVTPDEGVVKMVVVALPIVAPVDVGGRKLGAEFLAD